MYKVHVKCMHTLPKGNHFIGLTFRKLIIINKLMLILTRILMYVVQKVTAPILKVAKPLLKYTDTKINVSEKGITFCLTGYLKAHILALQMNL